MAQETAIDTDKLSYEIFSILESKFLFGLDDWSAPPTSDGGVTAAKNQRGKICVLSIDAGGMTSILAGKTLAYLETAIRKKSGDQTANIADYFDVAAGAGVGGIFTAMLFGSKDHSRPIFQADDTWKFLATQGKKFYRSDKKTNSKLNRFLCTGTETNTQTGSVNLEKALREAFTDEKGRCLTLKDTLKPVLIPCYDLATSASFVFSRADALETDGYDFHLWEVCRAAAAAPAAELGPVQVTSTDGRTRCVAVDGGVAVSNPAAAAITHVLHNKQEFPFVRGVEDILVLSLGTGQVFDGSNGYEKAKRWKAKDWARPMARISGDGSADFVDHAVAMAFGQSRSSNYVRIQANGSSLGHCGPNVDFDPSSSNVKMLMGIADEMLEQKNVESVLFSGKKIAEESNYEKLDWFAAELVLEHQRRSCRIAPTVVFKQANPNPI